MPKFHEKSLSRPGPGRRMDMYALPPFMDAMISEEKKIMKWVRIFQVGIFRGRGGGFSRGEFDEWEFPRGNFPRTLIHKLLFQKHLPRSVLWKTFRSVQKYFAKFTGITCVGVAFLIKLTIWLFIFTFGFISYSFLWNHSQVFLKVAILQNFAKVIWKHL